MTFRQCAETYIRTHATGWKHGRQAVQWSSSLERYVYPVFGSLPVQKIDTDLIVTALARIWTEKPETASRVRGRIESVLGWATASKFRAGDNPARWRGNLDVLLPRQVVKIKHHAAIHFDEIGAFMEELRGREGVAARALEFTILCAARTGEAIGALWDEINLLKRLWCVPAARMKAGREHVVPLSDAALTILEGMGKLRQGNFVFPGASPNRPLSNMAMLAVLRRLGRRDLSVHGFRSTFRDFAGDRTSFPREVCEAALAHRIGNAAEQAYRRGSALAKRARLMEAWAKHCAAPSTSGEVVPLQA